MITIAKPSSDHRRREMVRFYVSDPRPEIKAEKTLKVRQSGYCAVAEPYLSPVMVAHLRARYEARKKLLKACDCISRMKLVKGPNGRRAIALEYIDQVLGRARAGRFVVYVSSVLSVAELNGLIAWLLGEGMDAMDPSARLRACGVMD